MHMYVDASVREMWYTTPTQRVAALQPGYNPISKITCLAGHMPHGADCHISIALALVMLSAVVDFVHMHVSMHVN